MKKRLQTITLIALMLLAFQISTIKVWAQSNPTTTGPIGSQLAYGVNEDIKYWNGTVWVAIPSGLPGQNLKFINGVPTWVNNPNGITTNTVTNIGGSSAISGGHITSSSGSPITARGICWSTNHNPTLSNNFTTDDIGKGNYISNLSSLINNTNYYIRAYATNSSGTAYGNEISFTTIIPPVYDIDGNGYDTVVIGTQTWLKQNLKVTHYLNGDIIPKVIDTTWDYLTTGAYSNYNNDTNIANIYGRLYNWYTVIDSRNLCPIGWHVPSDNEWTILTTYLGGENIAATKLRETGSVHWNGSSQYDLRTNETGFTALPGGFCNNATYHDLTYYGNWWTTTEVNNSTYVWRRSMDWAWSSLWRVGDTPKYFGQSVRCLNNSVINVLPVKPVYDIDGNGYDTVHIGVQIWMKQNLKTTHYRNGDEIPNITNDTTWSNLTAGAYSNYNNDTNNGNIYGRLYNLYTIIDSRNLCPLGWHVPSDADFTTLTAYLGGESIAGGKLKETGTIHWVSPNTGASNETGFTALPGGNHSYLYYNLGYAGFLWSSTGTYLILYNDQNIVGKTSNSQWIGMSERCIKD